MLNLYKKLKQDVKSYDKENVLRSRKTQKF